MHLKQWKWMKNMTAVLSAAAVLCAAFAPCALASNWGLSFRVEGQQPVGNATQAELARYDAKYIGNTDEKIIYLTFDAGFECGCTPCILDTLKEHDVKAAFFLTGNFLEKNADLIRRMAAEGHIVGNHTYHHPDMAKISDEASFLEELQSLETLYTEITGEAMSKYYRPPGGVYSIDNLAMAKDLGYKTVFWSLAYVDWLQNDQPTRKHAFSKLLPRIHPGAVVLLHATSSTNAAILDELLTCWERDGYSFGTLDELFAL